MPHVKVRPCHRCKIETTQEFVSVTMSSGKVHYALFCLECREMAAMKTGGYFVAADQVRRHLGIDDLSILPSLQGRQATFGARCARCHKRGGELHHWAPRAYFDDADDWPQDYLCQECHRIWHEVMTQELPGFGVRRSGER